MRFSEGEVHYQERSTYLHEYYRLRVMTMTATIHEDAAQSVAYLLFQDFERRYRPRLGDRRFAELVRDAVQAELLPPLASSWVRWDDNEESDWETGDGENYEHSRELEPEPEPDEDGVLPAPRLILAGN